MSKRRYWYVKYPQDAYALGPVDFKEPVAERDVREWARRFDGIKRLPAHFGCWPTGR